MSSLEETMRRCAQLTQRVIFDETCPFTLSCQHCSGHDGGAYSRDVWEATAGQFKGQGNTATEACERLLRTLKAVVMVKQAEMTKALASFPDDESAEL